MRNFKPTLLLLALVLCSCQDAVTAGSTPVASPAVSPQGYPRVDGSTSTLPLQVTIACRLLQVRCTWQEGDLFSTTWRILPDFTDERRAQSAEMIFQLWHSGTHSAYVNLIHGEADVILVARSPSPDELEEARRYGVEMDVIPVARDAFVFITHRTNPVEGLTLEQIRSIYTGVYTSWSQVGGPDLPIHPYQRDRNSGSQELMEERVMLGTPMIDAPDMILEGMMGPIHAILDDTSGIGYSVYYYATRIFPQPDLKLLAIEGVQPDSNSLSEGTYPLTTEVYAVLRRDLRAGHPARKLVDWLLSPDGQDAVLASGYIPLLQD
jgi:phosphate transport system substrate-binding protein